LRCFFDTNVLVYSRDPDDAAKRALARNLIERSIEEESFVVSTQVLVEFYATSVRRRLPPRRRSTSSASGAATTRFRTRPIS
jgi:predicted nucleic acid-binding protein